MKKPRHKKPRPIIFKDGVLKVKSRRKNKFLKNHPMCGAKLFIEANLEVVANQNVFNAENY